MTDTLDTLSSATCRHHQVQNDYSSLLLLLLVLHKMDTVSGLNSASVTIALAVYRPL